MRGITERVLYVLDGGNLRPPRKPDEIGFERLAAIRSQLLMHLSPTTVVPRAGYAGLYHGRKQVIYQRAYESLLSRGITRKDSYVSTFVKAEKVNFSAKGDPAPRVIQPRSPRYNLEVGRYLKLFESELVHGFARMKGYNVILKGLNADGVASQLRRNWEHYTRPVAIGLMPRGLTNMSPAQRWSSSTRSTIVSSIRASCGNCCLGSSPIKDLGVLATPASSMMLRGVVCRVILIPAWVIA